MAYFAKNRNTAFFLGAGASAAFDYPVTAKLFPLMVEAAKESPFGKRAHEEQAAKRLRRGLDKMVPSWKNTAVAPPLITDTLSLLDQSILARTCLSPEMSHEDFVDFRQLLDRLLVTIIDREFWSESEFSDTCLRFIKLLLKSSTGIVTTNYDLEVDMALASEISHAFMETRVDYGFAWRQPLPGMIAARPAQPIFRLMKLHGSLNWLACPVCEHTYINVYSSIQALSYYSTRSDASTCHCGHFPLVPVIVSPPYVRDVRTADLLYLWKNALEYLRIAERWVLVGYSLPPEDLAIRSMLMRAYRARNGSLPKVEVVHYSEDPALKARYLSIFPNATVQSGGLKAFLDKQPNI
jgi:hypothetical protein